MMVVFWFNYIYYGSISLINVNLQLTELMCALNLKLFSEMHCLL